MSLGAIDFGLLLMELSLSLSLLPFNTKAAQLGPMSKEDRQLEIDQITYKSAPK
jgi:cobalt-zinc-cadmium resistance protein CzcA